MYSISYSFKNNFWVGNPSIEELSWNISFTAFGDEVYVYDGGIQGQGRGLGSVFQYDDSYFTGNLNYGWAQSNIYEYPKLPHLTVNGQNYLDVWTNYLSIGSINSIQNGDLVCYFAKGVGLVKMVNFHQGDSIETNLINYHIKH